MIYTIALIHPYARLAPLLAAVAEEVMADADLMHMVDEGIPRLITEPQGLTEPAIHRVCSLAVRAEEAKAQAVVLGSPMIGQALDAVRSAVRIPVERIDTAMVDSAVQYGARMGVLATSKLTMAPTLALIRDRADARQKDVTLEARISKEAEDALRLGDMKAFESHVIDGIEHLAGNDVIVLADVSMHNVAVKIKERIPVPVLSSPRLCFESLAKRLNYFRR